MRNITKSKKNKKICKRVSDEVLRHECKRKRDENKLYLTSQSLLSVGNRPYVICCVNKPSAVYLMIYFAVHGTILPFVYYIHNTRMSIYRAESDTPKRSKERFIEMSKNRNIETKMSKHKNKS